MAVAASLENAFEGQGRPRKKKAALSNLPSHYQFANWAYDDGKRYAVPVGGVRSDLRVEFPLISTTLRNEGTGTETLLWLHFDLDFKRADKKWIREGKLDWPTIAATLATEAPVILQYLSHVVRSSGGYGLSLALAISPLELIDETGDVQKLAFKAQDMVIRILQHYGMGADEGARGLKRLMPNIFRPDHVVDDSIFVLALVQKRRPRVLQNLLFGLRNHPALRVPKKSGREDILWADKRVEGPLARLYTDLLEEVGPWGSLQMSAGDLISRYGISKNTVYKLLSDPPKWLGAERISGEGYRLTISPTRALSDRAYDLLLERPEGVRLSLVNIAEPESVGDGERNSWLVSVILACKWKGMGQAETREMLSCVIRLVPGWQGSWSLTRGLWSILRSLYRNRSSLKGQCSSMELPQWLSEALQSKKDSPFSQTFYKKGSRRDLDPCAPLPVVRAEVGFEGASPLLVSSLALRGVRPGVRGGLAPCRGGGETDLLEQESGASNTDPLVLVFDGDVERFEPVPSRFDRAGRVEDLKKPVFFDDSSVGNTFSHLSGRELSGAFSKALMKTKLSAEEKGRILSEVTSEMDLERKDGMRREWLLRLTT